MGSTIDGWNTVTEHWGPEKSSRQSSIQVVGPAEAAGVGELEG